MSGPLALRALGVGGVKCSAVPPARPANPSQPGLNSPSAHLPFMFKHSFKCFHQETICRNEAIGSVDCKERCEQHLQFLQTFIKKVGVFFSVENKLLFAPFSGFGRGYDRLTFRCIENK